MLIRVTRALSKVEFPLEMQSGKVVAVGGVGAVNVDVAGGAPNEVFEGVGVVLAVGVRDGVCVRVGVRDEVGV